MKEADTPEPALPSVWAHQIDWPTSERGGQSVPFDPLTHEYRGVAGIVSDIDEGGVNWLRAALEQPRHKARIIIAVYPGCPTRTRQLSQLLDLQSRFEPRIRFRILPMTRMVGAPANCLAAIPNDSRGLVLLFGATPNFGIPKPDRTHLNMAFRADQLLSREWILWFDCAWEEAAPLTRKTVDIPPLVPVAGSKAAADQWRRYCDLCLPNKEGTSTAGLDEPSNNVSSPEHSTRSNRPSTSSDTAHSRVSEAIGLRTSDPIADRVSKLLCKGMQVAIVRDRGVAPLEFPISPKFFDQSAELMDGSVIHRQSFRISAFSKQELRVIERYRKASRTIINKLGLSLETGIYWMPDKVIELYKKEAQSREKEAQLKLSEIVGDSAQNFVNNKREEIKQDLAKTYRRINKQGAPHERALQEVIDGLVHRIETALNSSILAPVTYSSISFNLREKSDPLEAPWAQVEKLIFNLARFPREALCDPKVFNELTSTSFSAILGAMNIADDKVIELANKGWIDAVDRSTRDLKMIEEIAKSKIPERDRCQAYFMVIDALPYREINHFLEKVRPDDKDV